MIRYEILETAFGSLGLVASELGICRVILPGLTAEKVISSILDKYPSAVDGLSAEYRETLSQVQSYFSGSPVEFDPALDLSGSTVFQRQVYQALRSIPYGEVRSYAWVAHKIGNPRAVRAVGGANAANPIPLIIPCHRVIRADGSLGGFSGTGGPALKQRMLSLEKVES